MRTYQFRYMHGKSMPYKTLEALDDIDFYAQLGEFERTSGMKHVADSIVCTVSETRKVPEPPAREDYSSEALLATGERLLPHSIKTARAVVEKFLD